MRFKVLMPAVAYAAGIWSAAASLLLADRPTAPALFPSNTLAYVRVDDSRDMQAKFKQTSFGRISSDPQLKPILQELYGSVVDATAQLEGAIGVTFEELLSIPNGELSIAVIPGEETPQVAFLIEAGSELPAIQVILGRAETMMEGRGSQRTEEEINGVTLQQWKNPNRQRQQVAYFADQGVFVAATSVELAQKLARVWTGAEKDYSSLANNRRFLSVLSRCTGADGERPQVSFFVDPLALAKEVTKRQGGSSAVFAILPALGIDGVQAVGGAAILAPADFDSIFHLHLLLASPRRGVLEVVRPKSGETTPENWVPESINSYSTINWDIKKTLSAVEQLYDTFRGADEFENTIIQETNKRLSIDLRKDVIDEITGRFSIVQMLVRPATLNGTTNLYAIQVKNPDRFRKNVFDVLIAEAAKSNFAMEEDYVNGQKIYFRQVQTRQQSDVIRSPEICATMLDDYLLISDSKFAMTEAISTKQGNGERLADALDYKLVASRISAQLGDQETSIMSFSRPEEGLRLFYDLARDPANKERLKSVASSNPFFGALSNALEKHELPPFSVISKYLAPSGAFVTEDETGLHYTAFSMSRE